MKTAPSSGTLLANAPIPVEPANGKPFSTLNLKGPKTHWLLSNIEYNTVYIIAANTIGQCYVIRCNIQFVFKVIDRVIHGVTGDYSIE